MNLYGRPLTEPIDPAADRVPILDASATGDDNKMRDITVAQLQGALFQVQKLAARPTPEEVPDGTWSVCLAPDGGAVMIVANVGGEIRCHKLTRRSRGKA
jgi:hypothetical protein